MSLFKRKPPVWCLSRILDKDGVFCGTHFVVENPAAKPKDFPWLAYVTFQYLGRPVPTSEEMDRFNLFQDTIEAIEASGIVFQFGTITMNGKRDYMFYCTDREEAAKLFMMEAPMTEAQIEFMWDPKWKQHRDLLDMMHPSSRS